MSPEHREFESPLKNERILRLSECQSNGSTGKMSSNLIGRVLRKRKMVEGMYTE